MKSGAPYLLLTLLLLASNIAKGVGMPPLAGLTVDGYTVVANCENGPCSIEIWMESKDEKVRDSSRKIFENEPCTYTPTDTYQETRHFSCSSSGKSPLAGTKYISKPVNGDCLAGDPELEYKCTSGCEGNSRAPHKLLQGYWEC